MLSKFQKCPLRQNRLENPELVPPTLTLNYRARDILVVRRTDEMVLFREKEFSSRSLSAEIPLRAGKMEEGLGKEERFSGLLVIPS